MGQDSYIKIEWAKDYFGPDAVMVVRTDNVAQLCYYFRCVRDFVSKAKALGIGNPELPDDEYALLYEKEMAEEFCDNQDFRIFCMEKASAIMRTKNYINAFKVTGDRCDESQWMWHAKKTWPRCSGYHGEAEPRGQWIFCNRELPLTFSDFQAYKESLYKFNSYKDTRTDCYSLSDFDSNSSRLAYGFMPKWRLSYCHSQEHFNRNSSATYEDRSGTGIILCIIFIIIAILGALAFGPHRGIR